MTDNYFKTPYLALLYSAVAQALALIVGLSLRELGIPVFYYLAFHSLLAALFARLFKLSVIWQVLNAILPVAVLIMLQGTPPLVVKCIVCILLLLFVPTFYTKVPYYPSNNRIFKAVLDNLPKDNQKFNFLDAGCGSGRLLCYLAKHFPESNFVGVELNPFVFFVAKLISLPRKNVTIKYQNLWKVDFSNFDIIYAFLAPPLMVDIYQKVSEEMRAGTTFISNTFSAPVKETKRIEIQGKRQTDLFIYKKIVNG